MKSTHRAYIGLGSNLENPLQQVTSAVNALKSHAYIELEAASSWYSSKAVGPGEQPDYINGAVLLETTLEPVALLDLLQNIEQQHGRERKERWGARTLDLDLLLYDKLEMDSPRLQIPHPRICERNFVVKPLLDITPALKLPDGRQLQEILHIIGTEDIQVLEHQAQMGSEP